MAHQLSSLTYQLLLHVLKMGVECQLKIIVMCTVANRVVTVLVGPDQHLGKPTSMEEAKKETDQQKK